jgi:uncharacterized protein (DUF2384 family)
LRANWDYHARLAFFLLTHAFGPVQELARELLLSARDIMTKEGQLSSEGIEALRTRFEDQSRKAQAYYTVMHAVREIAGSDDAASAWMEKPLPAFDGKTPALLVGEGRAEEVLGYIDSL